MNTKRRRANASKSRKGGVKQHWMNPYLGRRLRVQRKAASMSQTTLGAAVGVSFQQIQKYEKGTNRISVAMLHEICMALDLSYADLLPSDGAEPQGRGEPRIVDFQQKHVTF